jgi:uncharacterized protein (TIGR03435 family)
MQGIVISAVALILASGTAFGQTQNASITFEVASVRPSGPRPPNDRPRPVGGTWSGGPGTADPGRIVYSRVPMQRILLNAYGLPVDQISGPDWILYEPYDIAAKIPEGQITKEQANLMLQNLLVERFHMTFHYQAKEFPAYELVVAANGPKLKATVAGPNGLGPPPASFRVTADEDGFPHLPPGARLGTLRLQGRTRARFRDFSLSELARWLGSTLGTLMPGPIPGIGNSAITAPARIADKTRLTGKYDFTLEYAGATIAAEALPPDLRDRLDENGPSIFNALEKQLGLKLQKTKVKVDMLMVDHIDKAPTEN